MAFRCDICGEACPAGTKAHKLILRKRRKEYPHRREVHKGVVYDEKGRKKDKWKDDPGGYGWEIACEAYACGGCARRFEQETREATATLKAG